MLLTNLSTEQLVGLNGDVFGDKALVGIAWEALAAFAMIATALLFLPIYMASGFTTTPAFLEKRFDKMTRSIVSGLFLFGYVTVLLPVVLYTGSLALITMFDLNISIWIVVSAIGLLGSSYAIFGGLKSVAVSDTLNGIGLLIGGLMIPVLALVSLGNGSFFEGISVLGTEKPEYLRVLAQQNLEGKKVSVESMIVPGSGLVKEQAENEGLDKVFEEAGFIWRDPGCSMCLGMNPDQLKPYERCASTSNRNFEGRQGYLGRTHLMSPLMAAYTAINGTVGEPS